MVTELIDVSELCTQTAHKTKFGSKLPRKVLIYDKNNNDDNNNSNTLYLKRVARNG